MGEQWHQSLTCAATHLDEKRAIFAVATEIIAQLADKISGIDEELREEAPGGVHGIFPLRHGEVLPLAALVIVWFLL